MRLEGKVALISGGARGQGAEEARLFTREGAKVVIGDVLEQEGQQLEAQITEGGGECLFIRLDVSKASDWQHAVEATVARFGKLNILVNNAGIGSRRTPDGGPKRLEDLSEEQWDQVQDVNSKGVFLGTRQAIPEMRKAGGGSIINISSIFGLIGSPGSSAYHASKGAVRLPDQSDGGSVRIRGDTVQLGSPRRHRHAHDGTPSQQPPKKRGDHQGHPHWKDRHHRGHRLWSAVPGLGRVIVRDRQRAGHRWRADGPIARGLKGLRKSKQAST